MPARAEHELIEVAGRSVTISNPGKILFPQAGYTKSDLVRYYLAVAGGSPRQHTRFTDKCPIGSLAWSRDGKRLALTRSTITNDIVLFSGLK